PAARVTSRPGPRGPRTSAIGTCGRAMCTQACIKRKWSRTLTSIEDPQTGDTVRGSGQGGCGTPGSSPYRCFLPDLTGFGDPSCAGPDLQRRLPRPVLRTQTSATEFGPAKADCRCRVPPAPHLARPSRSVPGPRKGRPRGSRKTYHAHLA